MTANGQVARSNFAATTSATTSGLSSYEISDKELERNSWRFPANVKFRAVNADDAARVLDYKVSLTQNPRLLSLSYRFATDLVLAGQRSMAVEHAIVCLMRTRLSPWNPQTLVNESFDRTPIPLQGTAFELASKHKWITGEYKHLWHNDSVLILQTPNDGHAFCSLCLSASEDMVTCRAYYVADQHFAQKASLNGQNYPIENSPADRPEILSPYTSRRIVQLHALLLPIRILETHVDDTRAQLSVLLKRITEVEKRIAAGKISKDTQQDNNLLNELSLEHRRLRKRWNFEKGLAANVLTFFEALIRSSAVGLQDRAWTDIFHTYDGLVRERIRRQSQYGEGLTYDFEDIPERIKSQSTAIFNYIMQRDNELNMQIARSSERIAEESRRDSSSMKTIAVLTLVFLPGTYVAHAALQLASQTGRADRIGLLVGLRRRHIPTYDHHYGGMGVLVQTKPEKAR
ncbi:MAG: hypothetical protein M1816_001408 [Peltula sp. TS41687]|nr:MAG: hypothetical protein M1816_001408 [Peltula sp. TS41687]